MKFVLSSSVFLTPWNTPIWIYLFCNKLHFDLHLPLLLELSKNPPVVPPVCLLPLSSVAPTLALSPTFGTHPGFSVRVVTIFLHYVQQLRWGSHCKDGPVSLVTFSLLIPCLFFMVIVLFYRLSSLLRSFILSKDMFECFAVYMDSYLGSKLSEFWSPIFFQQILSEFRDFKFKIIFTGNFKTHIPGFGMRGPVPMLFALFLDNFLLLPESYRIVFSFPHFGIQPVCRYELVFLSVWALLSY